MDEANTYNTVYWNNYKITRTVVEEIPEHNLIRCNYEVTDKYEKSEVFNDIIHEVDDDEVFIVLEDTNEEVYLNRSN